ncbi:MAG TPA: DUF1844 domain-containing protein [Pyrinomonadaceae bacterium]|nr:DUF1844 domain-containing protein [Pyrinomonadaceae bacterium]
MSEEKPHFKVTDRRLFNPDGTPREGVEREQPPPSATADAPPPVTAETSADDIVDAAYVERAEAGGRGDARAASEPSRADAATPPATSQESRGGAAAQESGDPTAFANLVMFIASPAAAAMGMTEHPGLAPGEVDLPLAKHCIDLLATVQQKTRGNLGQQEQQILEGLLAELRMQYVSLTSTRPPAPPRGFTGSDITGGR